MFSSAQLIGLYVFTLFIVYCILSKIMDIIRFNKGVKLWIKYYEVVGRTGQSVMSPKLGDINNIINKKEEKENEHNDSRRSEGVSEE